MTLTTPARTLPVYQEYLLPPAQTGGFDPPGFKSEGVFPWGSSRWVQGPLARRSFGEQSGRCPRHSAALPLHPALIKTEHVSLLIWSAALKRDALQSRSKAASCKTDIWASNSLKDKKQACAHLSLLGPGRHSCGAARRCSGRSRASPRGGVSSSDLGEASPGLQLLAPRAKKPPWLET